ncbi:ArsR/SmtB family transcription factor [Actinacidiphila acidipaludis]|uniref:Winged helix-turn-helix domain-containing protein n=1 Tax=Actinacidiphila acidipaludis TaxID=2873382 RepID=A0ABS7Q705_9ACTN|nr:winged helix-turn-helix domain-containing protein [Streptomyces acidipaludis]MBY8878919.1 winged helix-turn-helix domain-containing protein [Streptomyces acidipaludis]
MALRIHFTAEDLARVALVRCADMLWELVLSLAVLQNPQVPAVFRPWRSRASGALAAPGLSRPTRLLTTLVGPVGDFPDFLTPHHHTAGLPQAVDAVRSTPGEALRADLAGVFRDRRPPSWVRELAGGQPRRLAAVADAMRAYGRTVLLPQQRAIDTAVDADRSLRAHDLLHGGVHALLRGLPPPLRWSPPVLESDYPADRDLYLAGRGLTLVPAYFCWGAPVTFIDPELPPVLVYPVARAEPHARQAPGRLAELLGRTRAEALQELVVPLSTTELACRLGVSVPSASRHAAVLREAGLITSTRHGNTVVHVASALGRGLLGRVPGDDGPPAAGRWP